MLAKQSAVSSRIASSRVASVVRPVQRRTCVAKAVADVGDSDFKSLIEGSSVPVLVDFWAPWCGPCRMIAPIVEEIANEYKDKLKVVKLNTDEAPNTASDLGIRSIPTVMIFKGGKKMDTIIGAVPKTTLTQAVEKYL